MKPILEDLIPQYFKNKQELEEKKKELERDNAQIKELMTDEPKVEVDGYTATVATQVRTKLDEEKMINIIKGDISIMNNYIGLIKTKEYIDLDVLEDLLYNEKISDRVKEELRGCISETEVKTLTVKHKAK